MNHGAAETLADMSVKLPCEEQGVSRLLAGRVVSRLQPDGAQRLQEAAVQLMQQQQDLCSLIREVSTPAGCCQTGEQRAAAPGGLTGSLLESELRRQATALGVPVTVLSVELILERLTEITAPEGEEDERRELLTSSQRVQLCVLLESSRELMSQGALCPKLLWQEYSRDQRLPELEVLIHLHCSSFLSLKFILESDDGVRVWLVSRLKALCSWTPPQGEEETKQEQLRVLSTVVGVLVGCGFELNSEPAAPDQRRTSLLCCSLLDEMLFWLLDTVDKSQTSQSSAAGPGLWIQTLDASLCGVSASAEAVQRFFTHSLTQALTYKPRLTVSDAVTLQSDWTFVKADPLLMSLFRKLAVIFSVELLLRHLQQVLETHEVNWKHVLCFLSTLLVYNPCAPPSLRELLSRLLTSAFEGYDLEHMVTAFLLARQGALEGAGVFSSYSDWFKMSFGGSSGFHASSKKSLVFLLKFLSDLVPFEPPQYLKVHILHPPFVPVKHRSLLMEYISLAKTRLADLKESVEDMGLYEDVSGAGGASGSTQGQAVQDVEKAVSLFESTGRISATVMEASIFRRPYFLTRFLPALLKPRVLPVKADARMSLIEALKKAEKIPAAQHSSYVESCSRQRRQDKSVVCSDAADDPLEVLKVQLQEFRGLVVDGDDGDMMAQLSRISHTLCVVFPGRPEDLIEQTVLKVHVDAPPSPELHVKVINMILRNFCQCTLDASRANPPNKQNLWASRLVSVLLGNTQLICSLTHRLWDLFHNQGSSLSPAHVLGLAAFVVHLQASQCPSALIQLVPFVLPKPVPVGEAVSAALVCSTHTDMLFCVRFCLAAVCYGICRGDSLPQQQDHVPSSFYKKLLYLIPRLLPEARRPAVTAEGSVGESQEENLWSSATEAGAPWRTGAWRLWRHAAFQQLQNTPQYQLSFSDWLVHELRVQRSEDALSDPERQEYQQWACLELFLPRAGEQGGCGGDMRTLCSHVLDAVMDQQSKDQSLENLHQRASATGTCLPDVISRLQEFVYEMDVTGLSGSRSGRADVCDFLFQFISQRCSSSSVSPSVGSELGLQHTLLTWNRVLLALPPRLLVKLKAEGGRRTLDCTTLTQHVNQHQRRVCSPAGLMSFHLTSHLLRGVLSASVSCGRPREEVNKAWSQISVHCPLLLTSAVRWRERLSPVLSSLWSRVCDGEPLPEQLQLLTDCGHWAHSVARCLSPSPPPPPAPALLLASSLHRAWRGSGGGNQSFSVALNLLRPERESQDREVLVFLLFLCVNDHLLTLLCLQEESDEESLSLFSDLLCVLVDSSDWLLIFKSSEQGVYESVTMLTSDEFTRLLPWAFYSLLLQQSAELLHRVLCCPGFLQAAVLLYVRLLQLVLDGHAPAAEHPEQQVDPSQILSRAKRFLLRAISQTSLSSAQRRRLESQCADVDPEVAAALSVHLGAPSLSPEMDFL
ncbi:Fanconi anemia group A protein isoform X2 [Platichthys flesus]|uniref:Fanconi anemia group A protein isoform X2 n=1 Tax=Platichthys flesus TaxID=8260 RepID=UPI002DBCD2C8|nr:Fanconi anemia group A protein isoform X2 [Platichthys flesus]